MEASTDETWERGLRRLAAQALHEMQEHPGVSQDRGQAAERAPIVRLADELLDHAVDIGASDIHIEPQRDALRIRYRIDGMLCQRHAPLPLRLHPLLSSRLKIMAGMDTSERRRPLDGHIAYSRKSGGDDADGKIDFRVASMPVQDGEAISIRVLNAGDRLMSIRELGMSERNEGEFRRLVHMPAGMLIATGPMNSGKSTTLYAALQELNTGERHILTLEDPVEQVLPGVNQTEINEKIGLTFAKGLRSMLRMDADCIMIGEARDQETAQIAIRAALTGHMLLTTLHAKDSCTALYRLLEMGIPPYLLAATVTGIVAQRLVRRICPSCREEYEVADASTEAMMLREWGLYRPGMRLHRGTGCESCHGSGYRGRMAIHEILSMSDDLRTILVDGATALEFRRSAIQGGMRTMREDGMEKAAMGMTTSGEIGRVLYGN